MLTSDEFPPDCKDSLIPQINSWLGDMIRTGQLPSTDAEAAFDHSDRTSLPPGGSYELGAQFVMTRLDDVEVHVNKSLDRDLRGLVTPTKRRHHQLKYKHQQLKLDKAVAYARSRIDQNETLCQMFATQLAGGMEDAITWLDKAENQPPEFAAATWRVQLLTIPTYHAHAFLIEKMQNGSNVAVGDSYVFVISAPDWLKDLQDKKLLSSKEFLLGFQSKAPIIGLQAPVSRM